MGIPVDLQVARKRLEIAVEFARDQRIAVPQEWMTVTDEMGRSPSQTYVAMLGAALLAKATDERVEPVTHKKRAGPRGWSARSVCHQVLVPAASEFKFHLGRTGREPLNNQPFFRYDRLERTNTVRRAAQPFLDRLVKALTDLDNLSEDEALMALAAFLRNRMQHMVALQKPSPELTAISLRSLLEVVIAYLHGPSEGGRTGQALTAAMLDVAFDDVRTSRVNDPSRHAPGDVHVLDGRQLLLGAEVRQKSVSKVEVEGFVASLRAARIPRGIVAAFGPGQPALDESRLFWLAWERYEVLLTVFDRPQRLLLEALRWSPRPLELCLEIFPLRALKRLEELEVSESGRREWERMINARQ